MTIGQINRIEDGSGYAVLPVNLQEGLILKNKDLIGFYLTINDKKILRVVDVQGLKDAERITTRLKEYGYKFDKIQKVTTLDLVLDFWEYKNQHK